MTSFSEEGATTALSVMKLQCLQAWDAIYTFLKCISRRKEFLFLLP